MPLIDLNGLGHFKDRENAMIAENFAATKDYAAGDYCYFNGTLKKFKTAHAAGAWIGTDAEDAKLAGDVSSLKESINDIDKVLLNEQLVLNNIFEFGSDGGTITTNGITITKKNQNTWKINGTTTAAFNLNCSFHGFRFDSPKLYYHAIKTDMADLGGCYLQLGYFNSSGSATQLGTNVNAPNEYVSVSYPAAAYDSRFYFHFTSGVTFDNATLTFEVVENVGTLSENVGTLSENVGTLSENIGAINGFVEYSNRFKSAQAHSSINGVTIKDITNSAFTLDGTVVTPFNFEFAYNSINLEDYQGQEICVALFGDASAPNIQLALSYFNTSGSAVGSKKYVGVNEIYTWTVPSNAGKSRFYLTNFAVGTTFENARYYCYFGPALSFPDSSLAKNLTSTSYNSEYHTGAADVETAATKFSALMSGNAREGVAAVSKAESFLFFTDPHTFHTPWVKHNSEYMAQIQKMYRSTPTNFVLSGGDWLGNSDTPDSAAYKMGEIGAMCESMFYPCYMLVGNHDTNYQGKKDSGSAIYTHRFPDESISNFWYHGGKAYYTFEGANTKFYCFDTGIESQALLDMNNYGNVEVAWFANALLSDNSEHIALAMHIYYQTSENSISQTVMEIAAAYNARTSITINEITYNYANATGFIEFVIAGHAHADHVYRYTTGGVDIPVIITLDCGNNNTYTADCSYDLVFVDYDNRKIECIRVGVGADRTVTLAARS